MNAKVFKIISNIFVRKGTPFSYDKMQTLLSETPLRSKNKTRSYKILAPVALEFGLKKLMQ